MNTLAAHASADSMQQRLERHLDGLGALLRDAQAWGEEGRTLELGAALERIIAMIGEVAAARRKVIFIGNGGSAAIASHMAIDFARNGGVPAITFNDSASLTCLGNDFGYDEVFASQVRLQAHAGDLLMAISSSGSSANILRAVEEAHRRACRVVTFSGFSPDNPLRLLGEVNLYVPSEHYGRVEVSHLVLCHALLDLSGGWA